MLGRLFTSQSKGFSVGLSVFVKFPFADCIFTFSLTLRLLLGSWEGFNLNILFVLGSPYLCSDWPAIPGFK